MPTHAHLAVAALALGIAAVAPTTASADGRHGHHGRGHHYGHERYWHEGYRPYAHHRYGYRYAPVRYVYVRRPARVIYYDDYPYYAYYPRYYAPYRYYPRSGVSVSVGYADGPFYGGYRYRW